MSKLFLTEFLTSALKALVNITSKSYINNTTSTYNCHFLKTKFFFSSEFLSEILANKLTECQIHTLFLIFHEHWTLLIPSQNSKTKNEIDFYFYFFEVRIKAKK